MQAPALFNPRQTAHIPITVKCKRPGKNGFGSRISTSRQNGSDSGSHRTLATYQWTITLYQRGVAHLYPRHIGYAVELSGFTIKRHSGAAGTGFTSGGGTVHR